MNEIFYMFQFFLRHTQQFKLIEEIFQILPDLIKNLEVSELELNRILDVAMPYIHPEQLILMQQYCTTFLDNLFDYDAPAIYIKLFKNTKISHDHTIIYEKYSKINNCFSI